GGGGAPPRRAAAGGEGASPERAVALRVLQRVEAGAYADRALDAEVRRAGLDARGRAFATRLLYGAVQRRRTLDHVLDGLLDRPEGVEPAVRDVLRLGTYELLWSDRVPPSAAVDQAVRLVRALPAARPRAAARAGLVNAVLRRVADGGPARLAALDDPEVPAGVRHSVPDWIAEALVAGLGREDAEGVMRAANLPPESALRWNPLRGPRATVERALGLAGVPDPRLPEAIVLPGPFALEDSPLWASGRVMAQARASMLPARVLDPRPRERVLDLCAAPGAKATHLAALSRNGAEIVCVELHAARADALRALARRMGARLTVVVGDAREVPLPGPFDAVLVDAPCTGLGVLAARPDARWRRREESLAPLVALQRALLARALEVVHPAGRVVYSTCTLLPAENEDVVRASGGRVEDVTSLFPDMAHPGLPGALRTLPHVHGTDGFVVARIRP
ncbi:MAG TPA: 16S rRNA (cytosine(967)-C(5))-methyltransferase RsmB, partial [Miltoncostaeaceae bacterium]|nr:16S rRNA (cytosine(967)-C(5))-methyltransferase RsmB [Miltoncostaeaceae bacterium]